MVSDSSTAPALLTRSPASRAVIPSKLLAFTAFAVTFNLLRHGSAAWIAWFAFLPCPILGLQLAITALRAAWRAPNFVRFCLAGAPLCGAALVAWIAGLAGPAAFARTGWLTLDGRSETLSRFFSIHSEAFRSIAALAAEGAARGLPSDCQAIAREDAFAASTGPDTRRLRDAIRELGIQRIAATTQDDGIRLVVSRFNGYERGFVWSEHPPADALPDSLPPNDVPIYLDEVHALGGNWSAYYIHDYDDD